MSACSETHWSPPAGHRFELEAVRDGHVFAWQVEPTVQRQYLCCVVCKKPHHILFPAAAKVDAETPV